MSGPLRVGQGSGAWWVVVLADYTRKGAAGPMLVTVSRPCRTLISAQRESDALVQAREEEGLVLGRDYDAVVTRTGW